MRQVGGHIFTILTHAPSSTRNRISARRPSPSVYVSRGGQSLRGRARGHQIQPHADHRSSQRCRDQRQGNPKRRAQYGTRVEAIIQPARVGTSFRQFAPGNSGVRRLWTGAQWAEGPAWSSQGQYLVFSDVTGNTQYRYIWEDGRVTAFRRPSNNTNGNSVDFEGRQLSFEDFNRRVLRWEHAGSLKVIADNFEGKSLNSPNVYVIIRSGVRQSPGSHETHCWREMDSNFRFRARRNREILVSRRSSTDLVWLRPPEGSARSPHVWRSSEMPGAVTCFDDQQGDGLRCAQPGW